MEELPGVNSSKRKKWHGGMVRNRSCENNRREGCVQGERIHFQAGMDTDCHTIKHRNSSNVWKSNSVGSTIYLIYRELVFSISYAQVSKGSSNSRTNKAEIMFSESVSVF